MHVATSNLRASEYNPWKWDKDQEGQLEESIKKFGIVDPILVNSIEKRKNIVICGPYRTRSLQDQYPCLDIFVIEIQKYLKHASSPEESASLSTRTLDLRSRVSFDFVPK